jgi:hypothetical protein
LRRHQVLTGCLFGAAQTAIAGRFGGLPGPVPTQPMQGRDLVSATDLYTKVDLPRTSTSQVEPPLSEKRSNDHRLILVYINSNLLRNHPEPQAFNTPNHLAYVDSVLPFENNGEDHVVLRICTWGQVLTFPMPAEDLADSVRGLVYGERRY